MSKKYFMILNGLIFEFWKTFVFLYKVFLTIKTNIADRILWIAN